ncbi:MAG TPA: hypothetical protein VF184_00565 [Phycisphaeraceae bacterium]
MRLNHIGLAMGLWLAILQGAAAQVGGVKLEVERPFIGLGGLVRPGAWTPIRLTLEHPGTQPRQVVCRWLLGDADGDRVMAQRAAVLNPHRSQHVWLYAVPPANQRPPLRWSIQVLDAQTRQLLAQEEVEPPAILAPSDAAIGVMGSSSLGLEPYREPYTQHEAVQPILELSLSSLPDRWYGLAMLDAIIWTRQGGGPDDPALTLPMQQALRQWVSRGGHLVLVLPTIGQTWSSSPLADLLPVKPDQMRRVEGPLPVWVGEPQSEAMGAIQMTVFDPAPQQKNLTVLARDREGNAVIVAGRYGFGQVTLMGVDLTDPRLLRQGLPNGVDRVWNTVFHWQAPVYNKPYIEDEIRQNRMAALTARNRVGLDQFIASVIAMRNTVTPALLTAIVVFGLYWLLAGPVGFAFLKHRGALRHSWMIFLATVLMFACISWGGAYLMRPREASIAHLSVIDANARLGEAHVRSWLSLFVPGFGATEVALEPQSPQAPNTLASLGFEAAGDVAAFLDPQAYTVDAAEPDRLRLPIRATAKQLQADFLGPLPILEQDGQETAWVMPQGDIHLEQFWPVGELSHGLPGDLRDVLVVYCPGEGQSPWVWRHGTWPAKTILKLGPPKSAYRLVQRPASFNQPRQWEAEGYLGQLIGQKAGQRHLDLAPSQIPLADNEIIQFIEMLSFHAALPPPDFRQVGFGQFPVVYRRTAARRLDLTPLTAGRRLILIGYLDHSPTPLPITVDGQRVPSNGWTVVRWVYDLE